MQFFTEVLVGGLLAGVMYSLVAIGFVLIYKASGVFNFAQGAMVLFAALTYVGVIELGASPWVALVVALLAMGGVAIAVERVVLRRLVNRSPMTLFMATLGVSFILEGVAQVVWGAQVHGLDLGISDEPFELSGVFISKFDLFAAAVAGLLVLT
jgi:branched-chain amino acid transport system permease protein